MTDCWKFDIDFARKILRHALAVPRSGYIILSDGFISPLELITFDVYNGWLLTQKAQAHFAVHLNKKSKLDYTRGSTPKRVTSGRAHLRGLAPGLHSSEETSQRWRHCADWTGLGIKPVEFPVQCSLKITSVIYLYLFKNNRDLSLFTTYILNPSINFLILRFMSRCKQ